MTKEQAARRIRELAFIIHSHWKQKSAPADPERAPITQTVKESA